MTQADHDYLARRERESLAAAMAATDPCAQAIHAKLARSYRARRLAAQSEARPEIVRPQLTLAA